MSPDSHPLSPLCCQSAAVGEMQGKRLYWGLWDVMNSATQAVGLLLPAARSSHDS